MANLEFKKMLRGQAEIDRKRSELVWLTGVIGSKLANYPSKNLDHQHGCIENISVSIPVPSTLVGYARCELLTQVGVFYPMSSSQVKTYFWIQLHRVDRSSEMASLHEALHRVELLHWLYSEADVFLVAAKKYLEHPDVDPSGLTGFQALVGALVLADPEAT